MFIDICIGTISVAFVILVVYLVITLTKVIRMLTQTKRSMAYVDQLLKTTNDLALDFKEKSEAMNVFFQPLKRLNKKKTDLKHRNHDKIAEIINFAMGGIALFNALKKK
jgi:uncharacterized protein YoxC